MLDVLTYVYDGRYVGAVNNSVMILVDFNDVRPEDRLWSSAPPSAVAIGSEGIPASFTQPVMPIEASMEMWTEWRAFLDLKTKWKKEIGQTSLSTKIALSQPYQQIIGMGQTALPFIVHELKNERDNPSHWFWALSMITRADPIPVEIYGNHKEMARAWLSWADEHGVSTGGQRSGFPISGITTPL